MKDFAQKKVSAQARRKCDSVPRWMLILLVVGLVVTLVY